MFEVPGALFVRAAQNEEHNEPAGHVDQAVVKGGGSRRNVALVILVDERVNHNQGKRGEIPSIRECRSWRSAKGARGEVSKNGVLREVCDFPRDEMDKGQGFRARVGIKPKHERTDDARRVRSGEAVGRSVGDEDQPGDEW